MTHPNTTTNGTVYQHVESYGYDFDTAAKTSFTDQNKQITSFTYDYMTRPIGVAHPDGGTITFTYNDTVSSTSPSVHRQEAISGSAVADTWVRFDGLGRVGVTAKTNGESSPYDMTFTCYDALERKEYQSYPLQGGGSLSLNCASNPAHPGDVFAYDALGRVTSVTKADGSLETTNYGNYPVVLATDEAGKQRSSQTDALGRLITVWEDPNGVNYETDYQYDALGNLLNVNQKGGATDSTQWRTRTFSYDSLSRLLSATNPESGTLSYTYSNAGDVLTKTSPAPNVLSGTNTITYSYSPDPLHRITQRSSSGQPTESYFYDGSISGFSSGSSVGRLVQSQSVSSSGTVLKDVAYDVMGRPTLLQWAPNRGSTTSAQVQYFYNYDSSPQWVLYPSGRKVSYAYNVGQRPVSAIDSTNSVNYVTSAHYSAWGALSSAVYGKTSTFTGITLSNGFNTRMQPVLISAATSAATVLSLSYDYISCNSNGGDNGNICGVTNNITSGRSQSFTYDSLDRIASAQSAATSGNSRWGETFGIDPWANLTVRNVSKCTAEGAVPVPLKNNQLATYTYDIAGNVNNAAGPIYTYDGENRIISSSVGVSFDYDADGSRVRKSDGTLYWYGTGDEVLQETDLSNNLASEYVFFGGKRVSRRDASGNISYYLDDQIGSTRILATSAGTVCYDADFFPYGGEQHVYTNTCAQNYKFTGKERDTETGLDYFGARYYASAIGRWSTADWNEAPIPVPYADFSDPQTFNLYGYVRNSPLQKADSDGHGIIDPATFIRIASPHNVGQFLVGAGKALLNQAIDVINSPSVGMYGNHGITIPNVPTTNTAQTAGAVATSVAIGALGVEGEEAVASSEELAERASEIHSALDPIAQRMRTTAVADATNADGTSSTLAASSRNTLSPAQRGALQSGETAVKGSGHAEATILNSAEKNGQKVNSMGVSRQPCAACQQRLNKANVKVSVKKPTTNKAVPQ